MKSRENAQWKEDPHEVAAHAWLAFQLPNQTRRWLWLEHDRGEASPKKIKKHLRGILAFIQAESHKAEFGAAGIKVVYTTSAGPIRLHKLRAWTRDVLQEHVSQTKLGAFGTAFSPEAQEATTQKSFSRFFVFTAVPPLSSQPLDPKTLFGGNVWYHPFGEKPTALFRIS